MVRGLQPVAFNAVLIAVASALLLLASPVRAEEGRTLECGIVMGGVALTARFGKKPEEDKENEEKQKEALRLASYLPGPQVTKLQALNASLTGAAYTGIPATGANALMNEPVWYKRSRLPAAVTIANIGCVWL